MNKYPCINPRKRENHTDKNQQDTTRYQQETKQPHQSKEGKSKKHTPPTGNKKSIFGPHLIWIIFASFIYKKQQPTTENDKSCMFTDLIVLSELPLTTKRSRYCKQAMPRLWPFSVRTNSQVDVFHTCDSVKTVIQTSVFNMSLGQTKN